MNESKPTIYQNPVELRQAIRSGQFTSTTSGQCPQFIQANMAIVPKSVADKFLLFCQSNPRACPILEILPSGSYTPTRIAKTHADIRTDIPKYEVYENGQSLKKVRNISEDWNNDMVTFLLGCSFSFEHALQQNGIRVKNIDEQKM